MIVQIYETGSAGEARALAGAGVDHVGVLVGGGDFPRELGNAAARTIFEAVADDAARVALSLSAALDKIARVVEETQPDILHLGTLPELLGPGQVVEIKEAFPGLRIMRTVPVEAEDSIQLARDYDGVADFLLLDTHGTGDAQIGATGKTHDWRISGRIVKAVRLPVILAGGLGPDNVARAIAEVRPAGVDSKTLTDIAGCHDKDLDKVREFVRAARATA